MNFVAGGLLRAVLAADPEAAAEATSMGPDNRSSSIGNGRVRGADRNNIPTTSGVPVGLPPRRRNSSGGARRRAEARTFWLLCGLVAEGGALGMRGMWAAGVPFLKLRAFQVPLRA